MIARILLGLVFMAIGIALMYFSYPIVEHLGRNTRAEEHLGGTRNLILFIGFGLIIVGGLFMFGMIQIGATDQDFSPVSGI